MRTNVKQGSIRLQDYRGASVLGMAFMLAFACLVILRPVSADNFTDVFNTQSFRGSFEWFRHMDWLGTVVQAVISIFALLGTCLIVIRIMTSMLYLSAKGLWEEVHDLKQSSGESEMYDLGLLNMAKSWAKGKGGYTGIDAIMGAILTLLPDVKRYSDFGEKSGQKFEEDTSVSQYMLKILLPTVLSVFFLAMAFNGTLVKGLAVTVDAMGTIADKAVSVNYSGFVEDLVNSQTGYKFIAGADGTKAGDFVQSVQTEVYGKVVSRVRGVNQNQLYTIGQTVESTLSRDALTSAIAAAQGLDPTVKAAFDDGNPDDYYWELIDADVVVGGSKADREGVLSYSVSELMGSAMDTIGGATANGEEVGSTYYINIYFDQKKASTGGTMWTTDGSN